jgi:Fanconi anemia group M protein
LNFSGQSRNRFVIRGCISPVHLQEKHDVPSLSCRETEKVIVDSGSGKNVCTSPVNETQTPLLELKNCAIRRGRVFVSQIEEGRIHIVDPSFSEESHPSCGERSVSIKPARKFKRLRKVEDTESNMNQKKNNIFDSTMNFSKPSPANNPTRYKHGQGDFCLFWASFIPCFIYGL